MKQHENVYCKIQLCMTRPTTDKYHSIYIYESLSLLFWDPTLVPKSCRPISKLELSHTLLCDQCRKMCTQTFKYVFELNLLWLASNPIKSRPIPPHCLSASILGSTLNTSCSGGPHSNHEHIANDYSGSGAWDLDSSGCALARGGDNAWSKFFLGNTKPQNTVGGITSEARGRCLKGVSGTRK